jgi:hypothetical protein
MKQLLLVPILLLLLAIPAIGAEPLPDPAIREKFIGSWVRPDGGYTLLIKAVNDDGSIDAEYFNPNPINVSKAQVSTESGKTNIFVELRDVGYPGSYYTLVYDPDSDRLAGVYHHLVFKQNFDVYFVRK